MLNLLAIYGIERLFCFYVHHPLGLFMTKCLKCFRADDFLQLDDWILCDEDLYIYD